MELSTLYNKTSKVSVGSEPPSEADNKI